MKKPELLAPVGSPEALTAAISGGANAVYLGLENFNARQKAGNFTLEDLKEALELAHKYNVKVYIAINTLIKEKELKDLIELLNQLRILSIDGLIVQDLGLIYLLQKYYPEFSLQLSTQASVYGKEGAKFFDELGFDRVVLARETGINEVSQMKKELDTEIKIFNHGALCYAYSGQCHLSSAVGKRSGNRGTCAQPCRQYYDLLRNNKVIKSGYLLSTKDLNTLDRVQELVDSEADALKIEGRMKTPEYVYAVTKAYRNRLDHKEIDENQIRTVFNRDFTDGRLFLNNHNLSQKNPKKRGELIGKISKVKNDKLFIQLKKGITLINGDGLSFGEEETQGMNISKMLNQNFNKINKAQDKVIIPSNLRLNSGTPVYRSFNKQVMDELSKNAKQLPDLIRTPISFQIRIKEKEPVQINLFLDNQEFLYRSNIIPQKAQSKPIDLETLKKQFSKLGNTPYKLNSIEAEIDSNLFLSLKELNQLRREALEVLKLKPDIENTQKIKLEKRLSKEKVENPILSVKFENIDQAKENLEIEAEEVVLTIKDFNNLSKVKEVINTFKKKGKNVLLTTSLVIDSKLAETIKKSTFLDLEKTGADGFLIQNFELLELLKEIKCYKEVDSSFNIFNTYSGKILKDWGISNAVLSDELSRSELQELSQFFPIDTTVNAGGKRLLMVSANCVMDCPNCLNCSNEGIFDLINKRGDKFKLKIEDNKNFIYNHTPTLLGESKNKLPFVNKFRINLTDETSEEVHKLIKDFNKGLNQEVGNYKGGVF